jgi:hypothetical protein
LGRPRLHLEIAAARKEASSTQRFTECTRSNCIFRYATNGLQFPALPVALLSSAGAVKDATRRLGRLPSAILDRACVRQPGIGRSGRRDGPGSVEQRDACLVQAAFGLQSLASRTIALRITSSLRMQAVMMTLGSLPASRLANAAMTVLCWVAESVAM